MSKPTFPPAELSVDGKQLQAALSRAIGAVERKSTYPILLCVHLSTEDGELVIRASDLEAEVSIRLPHEGDDLAPICVESARLLAIAGQLKDRDRVTLRFSAPLDARDGVTCTVSAGRSRFTLETMEASAFPSPYSIADGIGFTLPAARLAEMFAALWPAISTEQTRYYLCGIFLDCGTVAKPNVDGNLVMVATNGHTMVARHIEVEGVTPELGKLGSIIVPRLICGKVGKLFAGAGDVAIRINAQRISFAAAATLLVAKLVEGHFPDWRRVSAPRPPTHAYDSAELIRAVEAASAVNNGGKGKAVKLVLDGAEETTIEAKDFNNPGFTGADVCRHSRLAEKAADAVGINADYLVEMLRSLDAETAELSLDDPGAPVVMTGAALDDRRIIIMPVRV